jgi:hypothetical protein
VDFFVIYRCHILLCILLISMCNTIYWYLLQYKCKQYDFMVHKCIMPLSTIFQFQLYRGGQFYWWRKPEESILIFTNLLSPCPLFYTFVAGRLFSPSTLVSSTNKSGDCCGCNFVFQNYYISKKNQSLVRCGWYSLLITHERTDREILVVMNYSWVILKHYD